MYVQYVCVLLRMRVGRWLLTMWRKFVVFSKPESWNHRWRRRDAILRLSFLLLHICPYLRKFPSRAFAPLLLAHLFHFSLSPLLSRRTRAIFSLFLWMRCVVYSLVELFLSVLMMHSYSVTTHFLLCRPPPSSYWLRLSYWLLSLCIFKEVANVYFCVHVCAEGSL